MKVLAFPAGAASTSFINVQTRPFGRFQKGANMQFAKVQGSALAALGLLLLLLQGFLFFSSMRPAGSPAEISPAPQAEHKAKYLPGIIGLVALGFGGYLVVQQRKRGGNEDVQPEKTSSGLPM